MHLKHTFDKQFWLLETTVVIALKLWPRWKKKRSKGISFMVYWGLVFPDSALCVIRWRYKKYSLELLFCLITGIWCWIGFCRCGCPCSLITVDWLLHFPGRSKSSFTGTSLVKNIVKQTVFTELSGNLHELGLLSLVVFSTFFFSPDPFERWLNVCGGKIKSQFSLPKVWSFSSCTDKTSILFNMFLRPLVNSSSFFWLYECPELSVTTSIY